MKKEYDIIIYSPAYIQMTISRNKDNLWTGDWYLDDPTGWTWYSDNGDMFLLGLLRIIDSSALNDFTKELIEEQVPLEVFKEAILNSLEKSMKTDPYFSDGLYHAMGDNIELAIDHSVALDIMNMIEQSLKSEGLTDDEIEDISDTINLESIYQDTAKSLREKWVTDVRYILATATTYDELFELLKDLVEEYRDETYEELWYQLSTTYTEIQDALLTPKNTTK